MAFPLIPVVTSLLGIGSSIYGANKQADAAKDAARVTAETADENIQLLREQDQRNAQLYGPELARGQQFDALLDAFYMGQGVAPGLGDYYGSGDGGYGIAPPSGQSSAASGSLGKFLKAAAGGAQITPSRWQQWAQTNAPHLIDYWNRNGGGKYLQGAKSFDEFAQTWYERDGAPNGVPGPAAQEFYGGAPQNGASALWSLSGGGDGRTITQADVQAMISGSPRQQLANQFYEQDLSQVGDAYEAQYDLIGRNFQNVNGQIDRGQVDDWRRAATLYDERDAILAAQVDDRARVRGDAQQGATQQASDAYDQGESIIDRLRGDREGLRNNLRSDAENESQRLYDGALKVAGQQRADLTGLRETLRDNAYGQLQGYLDWTNTLNRDQYANRSKITASEMAARQREADDSERDAYDQFMHIAGANGAGISGQTVRGLADINRRWDDETIIYDAERRRADLAPFQQNEFGAQQQFVAQGQGYGDAYRDGILGDALREAQTGAALYDQYGQRLDAAGATYRGSTGSDAEYFDAQDLQNWGLYNDRAYRAGDVYRAQTSADTQWADGVRGANYDLYNDRTFSGGAAANQNRLNALYGQNQDMSGLNASYWNQRGAALGRRQVGSETALNEWLNYAQNQANRGQSGRTAIASSGQNTAIGNIGQNTAAGQAYGNAGLYANDAWGKAANGVADSLGNAGGAVYDWWKNRKKPQTDPQGSSPDWNGLY